MISRDNNPVEWSAFMYELEDAHEHLGRLIAEITADRDYDEANLSVDLGHVMAHLNRAWASRNLTRPLTAQERESFREYPHDLRPIA